MMSREREPALLEVEHRPVVTEQAVRDARVARRVRVRGRRRPAQHAAAAHGREGSPRRAACRGELGPRYREQAARPGAAQQIARARHARPRRCRRQNAAEDAQDVAPSRLELGHAAVDGRDKVIDLAFRDRLGPLAAAAAQRGIARSDEQPAAERRRELQRAIRGRWILQRDRVARQRRPVEQHVPRDDERRQPVVGPPHLAASWPAHGPAALMTTGARSSALTRPCVSPTEIPAHAAARGQQPARFDVIDGDAAEIGRPLQRLDDHAPRAAQ